MKDEQEEEILEDPLNENENTAEEVPPAASPVPAPAVVAAPAPTSVDKEEKDKDANLRSLWVTGLNSTVKAADLKVCFTSSPLFSPFHLIGDHKKAMADFQSLFSEHGKVVRAKIFTTKKQQQGNPRNYGFVTMADIATAEKCIMELNKKPWKGMTLVVKKVRLCYNSLYLLSPSIPPSFFYPSLFQLSSSHTLSGSGVA